MSGNKRQWLQAILQQAFSGNLRLDQSEPDVPLAAHNQIGPILDTRFARLDQSEERSNSASRNQIGPILDNEAA